MRMALRQVLGTALVAVALVLAFAGTLNAQVPTAEAQAFIGDWDVAIEGDAPSTIRLTIRDNGGQVAAAVVGIDGNSRQVTGITKKGNDLVLSYTTSLQGTDAPVTITLASAGGGLTGNLDLGGGLFSAPLKGTKRAGS
jgi:hypothetical protein